MTPSGVCGLAYTRSLLNYLLSINLEILFYCCRTFLQTKRDYNNNDSNHLTASKKGEVGAWMDGSAMRMDGGRVDAENKR